MTPVTGRPTDPPTATCAYLLQTLLHHQASLRLLKLMKRHQSYLSLGMFFCFKLKIDMLK